MEIGNVIKKREDTMGNALKAGHTPSKAVPEGYKRTEVGVIPEDWIVTRLGDCGEVIMGKTVTYRPVCPITGQAW